MQQVDASLNWNGRLMRYPPKRLFQPSLLPQQCRIEASGGAIKVSVRFVTRRNDDKACDETAQCAAG